MDQRLTIRKVDSGIDSVPGERNCIERCEVGREELIFLKAFGPRQIGLDQMRCVFDKLREEVGLVYGDHSCEAFERGPPTGRIPVVFDEAKVTAIRNSDVHSSPLSPARRVLALKQS